MAVAETVAVLKKQGVKIAKNVLYGQATKKDSNGNSALKTILIMVGVAFIIPLFFLYSLETIIGKSDDILIHYISSSNKKVFDGVMANDEKLNTLLYEKMQQFDKVAKDKDFDKNTARIIYISFVSLNRDLTDNQIVEIINCCPKEVHIDKAVENLNKTSIDKPLTLNNLIYFLYSKESEGTSFFAPSQKMAKLINLSSKYPDIKYNGVNVAPLQNEDMNKLITSKFGRRINPVTKKIEYHNGIDFRSPNGTPVYALSDGIVLQVASDKSRGNYVIIYHGNDFCSLYQHLNSAKVQAGYYVKGGDLIGEVGSTGQSTGNHLHLETFIDGKPYNPKKELKKIKKWQTLFHSVLRWKHTKCNGY